MSIHRIETPEVVVPGKRLGRHILIDSRSERFPAETAPTLKSVTHKAAGLPLDQGNLGSCTANALCGALNTVPHWAAGQPTLGERDAVKLYSEETALEGDPYPPNDPGGTGIEVCKAAKNAGMLSAYQHAFDIHAALAALVLRPVIAGMNWFTSFDTPLGTDGYIPGLVEIRQGATVRGGHEIVAVGIDDVAELVWFVNSWGLGYGVPLLAAGIPGGCFCMSFSTLEALLRQGGDCVIPRTAPGWVASPS